MAEIQFRSGLNNSSLYPIADTTVASGIGFYGSTFGTSVQVGQYQDTTFITNSTGNVNGGQANNAKYLNTGSGTINGTTLALRDIHNVSGTLNIRFTHTSAVQTANAVLRIFDRVNSANGPSGVNCMVASLIHPYAGVTGSGSAVWIDASGSVAQLSLADSPGEGGTSPNGAATSDDQHDWYVLLSAKPQNIGAKTQFGLYVELQYM